MQLRMTVPFILRAFWDCESALRLKGIRHCHPTRSTPRFARRFTAPNDSHHYSTRFLRLGGRAPNKGDALSSSALHSALCASLRSFEWQSLLLYALFEIGRARSEYQWLQGLQEKRENLGAPNGAQKSSLLGAMSPQSTVVLILAHRWRWISKNEMHM